MELLVTTVRQQGLPGNRFEVGDILAVKEDGAPWGARETMSAWLAAGNERADFPNPHFGLVKVPGLPLDLNLTEPTMAQALKEVDGNDIQRIAKRCWHVDPGQLDALGGRYRSDLYLPGGEITLTIRQARRVIRHHRTGQPYPDATMAENWSGRRPMISEAARVRPAPPAGQGRAPRAGRLRRKR